MVSALKILLFNSPGKIQLGQDFHYEITPAGTVDKTARIFNLFSQTYLEKFINRAVKLRPSGRRYKALVSFAHFCYTSHYTEGHSEL